MITIQFKEYFNNTYDLILYSEDFKTQRVKFIQQGYQPDIVDNYLNFFKDIKQKKYKEATSVNIPRVTPNNRYNVDAYQHFEDLEAVVDYVRGQRSGVGATFEDVQFDAKPKFDNGQIQIFYADSPHACVQYKGKAPYSWCIARTDSNMYYTYRFKDHEPSFYFVKNVEKTKNEFALWNNTDFNGNWRDKYHFFVIQVLKGANPNDDNNKQYKVTSAQNDGDKQMSWNDILQIEPKLQGLKQEFVNVPLTSNEKEDYRKFVNGVSDDDFKRLTYEQKGKYLDIYVRSNKKLSSSQFADLPDDLKNKYVGFGIGLNDEQFELVKSNGKLLKRYKEMVLKNVQEGIKDKAVWFELMKNLERSEIEIINQSDFDFNRQFLNKVLNDPYASFTYAKALGFKHIPQEIIDGIAKSERYSHEYAQALGFKNVPQEISDSINPKYYPDDDAVGELAKLYSN